MPSNTSESINPLKFKFNGNIAHVFGARHSRDSSSEQFNELSRCWAEFFAQTVGDKLVIREGAVGKNITDYKNAIEKYGESGAIAYLAEKDGVNHLCIEPAIEYESVKLLEKFSQDQVFYFYTMRGGSQWARLKTEKSFQDFVIPYISKYSIKLGWKDFNFTFENLKQIHKDIFDNKFLIDDKPFLSNVTNPESNQSIINQIACQSTEIRNNHICTSILKLIDEHKNLFIVYGLGHIGYIKQFLSHSGAKL